MITELNRFLCENLVQYPSVCDHAYYYNSGIFQCGGGDRDDQNIPPTDRFCFTEILINGRHSGFRIVEELRRRNRWAKAVQKEIDNIKGNKDTEKLLTIQCFGNFEVLYNGKLLSFKRKKTKEFLAVLVDRNGAGMTAKRISAILFPNNTDDTKNAAYLRQLVMDLKNTLKAIHAEGVLQHNTPYYRIDTNLVRCDYFSYLAFGKPKFYGEYMTQYSWAEVTCAMLQHKK